MASLNWMSIVRQSQGTDRRPATIDQLYRFVQEPKLARGTPKRPSFLGLIDQQIKTPLRERGLYLVPGSIRIAPNRGKVRVFSASELSTRRNIILINQISLQILRILKIGACADSDIWAVFPDNPIGSLGQLLLGDLFGRALRSGTLPGNTFFLLSAPW